MLKNPASIDRSCVQHELNKQIQQIRSSFDRRNDVIPDNTWWYWALQAVFNQKKTSKRCGRMSFKTTYFLVDNTHHLESKDKLSVSIVSFFTYNYLISGSVFNKSNKVALLNYPWLDFNNVSPKALEWKDLALFMDTISKTEPPPGSCRADLVESLTDLLQSVCFSGPSSKTTDIIVVSAFEGKYSWATCQSKMQSVLKSYDKINLICVDSSTSTSCTHEENLEILNRSILGSNSNNEKNFLYTIQDAVAALTKTRLLAPKFKKPVEIYSHTLQILGLAGLELNISAYPFVKKSSLHDYLPTKSIDSKLHTSIKEKSIFYYEEREGNKQGSDEDASIKLKEITDPEFITDGYKFGTSSFLLTDLPSDFLKMDTVKSMVITSFFPKDTVPPWYLKQDSLIVLPYSKNYTRRSEDHLLEKDFTMFSELWYSMVRRKVFANVRFVKRNGQEAKYGILYPQGYVDKESEESGAVDFGCFIFVETIYKDDEKLVNLPNLEKVEVGDPELEAKIDGLVRSYNIDDDNSSDEEATAGGDNPSIDACVVSMNEDPANDLFYNLRDEITQESEGEPSHRRIFSDSMTAKIAKFNNPLMSIERLVYLISYFILQQHLKAGGDPSTPLYTMCETYGMPVEVIRKWTDAANEEKVFYPTIRKQGDLKRRKIE